MWTNLQFSIDLFTITKKILNPLLPDVLFLYPLKTSENLWFSDVFRGYKNGTPGSNGLILIWVGGRGANFTPPVGFPLITQKR